MKLLFIRHGQATAYCADDAGRNLTQFGQEQAHETACHIAQHHQIDLIISSPFNRANQTAKILQQAAIAQDQNPNFITLDSITPNDDPVLGLANIEQIISHHFGHEHNKTIAIVCHMPIIAYMTAHLEGLSPFMFELAECRVLQTEVVAQNLAQQIQRFIPKQPSP